VTAQASSSRWPASRSDATILAELLALHAVGERGLDASWAHGRIWSPALLKRYRLTRLDIRPETQPDVIGDWNRLGELFAGGEFDVVVWDPPHITDAGHLLNLRHHVHLQVRSVRARPTVRALRTLAGEYS
jgi:hypothetical protein